MNETFFERAQTLKSINIDIIQKSGFI